MFEKDNIVMSLKVLEAYTRDVGRGIARLDHNSMDSLKISADDIIEITGKKRTVATCLPLYPSDEGKGIVRIDGLIRNNAGVALGDTVAVKKIKAKNAEKIVVAPLEDIPPIDERYLADSLQNVPVIKGDNVMVPYFGGRLTFQIIGVIPSDGVVLITQKTVFRIAERIPTDTEKHMGDLSAKLEPLIDKYYEQFMDILSKETLDEELLLETFDKLKKLNEIISYLSKQK